MVARNWHLGHFYTKIVLLWIYCVSIFYSWQSMFVAEFQCMSWLGRVINLLLSRLHCFTLHCTVLHCTLLYCILYYSLVLYTNKIVYFSTVLYIIVLYFILLYFILCSTVHCFILSYSTLLWNSVIYITLLHCIAVFSTLLYLGINSYENTHILFALLWITIIYLI